MTSVPAGLRNQAAEETDLFAKSLFAEGKRPNLELAVGGDSEEMARFIGDVEGEEQCPRIENLARSIEVEGLWVLEGGELGGGKPNLLGDRGVSSTQLPELPQQGISTRGFGSRREVEDLLLGPVIERGQSLPLAVELRRDIDPKAEILLRQECQEASGTGPFEGMEGLARAPELEEQGDGVVIELSVL